MTIPPFTPWAAAKAEALAAVDEKRRAEVETALITCKGNVTATADKLGITRSYMNRLLVRFELVERDSPPTHRGWAARNGETKEHAMKNRDWIDVHKFWSTAEVPIEPGVQIEVRHASGLIHRYLFGNLDDNLSMGDDGDWFSDEDVVLRYRVLLDEDDLKS